VLPVCFPRTERYASFLLPGKPLAFITSKKCISKARERERERGGGNRVRRLRCKRRVFSSGQTASETLGDCCRAETNGRAFARNYSARSFEGAPRSGLVIIGRTPECAAERESSVSSSRTNRHQSSSSSSSSSPPTCANNEIKWHRTRGRSR